jgi:peptidoglycan/LPS O-acetylase OafA/YrhL
MPRWNLSTRTDHKNPVEGGTWLVGIEALRGIAAGTVLLHHAWSLSTQPSLPRQNRIPFYWVVEGFGLWGVMLFFMLSGYLLADSFWRTPRVRVRDYAIRRFFRIAPAYYVNLAVLFLFFAPPTAVLSMQGLRQIVANLTFTHYLFPNYSSSLNVNGALWTLTIEIMLYAFLPIMALAVRANPWLATLFLVAVGLGWRAWVAYDGSDLRAFYFGNTTLDEGIQSLFIARQFVGAVAIFALGIIVRWLVVHGRFDSLYKRTSPRLGVGFLVLLMLPSIFLLKWVELGSDFRNPLLFTIYDFALMVALVPALIFAGKPTPFPPSPLRSTSVWLGERSYSIYLWHFPIILSLYERGAFEMPPAISGYWWRVFLAILVTLIVASASYKLVEQPAIQKGRELARKA